MPYLNIFIISFFLLCRLYGDTASLRYSTVKKTIDQAYAASQSDNIPAKELSILNLKPIFSDEHTKTVPADLKAQALFLLSRLYEQTNHPELQDILLSTCAKDPSLFRYHIQILTTHCQFFLTQNRFSEAILLLKKVHKKFSHRLSIEEQIQITTVMSFADSYIATYIQNADIDCAKGRFSKALQKYTAIYPIFEAYIYPLNSSRLEKKRFFAHIRIRIAEILFCLGRYEESAHYAQKLEENLFASPQFQPIYTRQLALLSLLLPYLCNPPLFPSYQQCPFHKDPNLDAFFSNVPPKPSSTLTLLLFYAHTSVKQKNFPQLTTVSLQLIDQGAHETAIILQGLHAYYRKNYTTAHSTLLKALSSQETPITHPFYASALTAITHISLFKTMLLTLMNDTKQLHTIANAFFPYALSSTVPDTHCLSIAFLVCCKKISSEQSKLLLQTCPKPVSPLLFEKVQSICDHPPEEQTKLRTELISLMHAAKIDILCDIKKYLYTIETAYQSAEKGPISEDEYLALQSLLCETFLEGRYLVLKCLIETSLMTQSIDRLSESLKELPSIQAPEIAFSTLVALENISNTETLRQNLCNYLFSLQEETIPGLYALLHLFENDHGIYSPRNKTMETVQNSLIAREEARLFKDESCRSEEPHVVQNLIKKSIDEYTQSILLCKEALLMCSNQDLHPFLTGLLFTLHEERALFLLSQLPITFVYPEFSTYLSQADSQFHHDFEQTKSMLTWKESRRNYLADIGVCLHIVTHDIPTEPLLLKENVSIPLSHTLLFIGKILKDKKMFKESILYLEKASQTPSPNEVSLEADIERSLCYRELEEYDAAFSILGSVINSPTTSSLRLKAMVLRAELYSIINRKDLAIRQLESIQSNETKWGIVAMKKLQELYGHF